MGTPKVADKPEVTESSSYVINITKTIEGVDMSIVNTTDATHITSDLSMLDAALIVNGVANHLISSEIDVSKIELFFNNILKEVKSEKIVNTSTDKEA